ncbi:MAG: ribose 5-phosphate isomerase A [Candidatus Bathyarchaeia archaeon]
MKKFWRDWGRWKLKPKNINWIEDAKRRAALEAVKHVKNGSVIGLGSGSTAAYVVQELGRRIREEGFHVLGVPTSYQAYLLALECGVPTTTLDMHPQLDLTIDGADQVDLELNIIKGAGGALTREKVVASASKQFIIVVDETKKVSKLGANHPVPLEVLPFATSFLIAKLREMGGKPVLRMGKNKVGPVVTDNGNFLVDVDFGIIKNPKELNANLKSIPGVIETGLFLNMANIVYVGKRKKVEKLERK